jgi:hypothetical protein
MSAISNMQRMMVASAIALLLCAGEPAWSAEKEWPTNPPPAQPTEEAPTPSEVPADRPISELDSTEQPPPTPEQAAEDRTGEAGPPSPPEEEPPSALGACKEIQPEQDTVLHRVRRSLAVTACASSAWLDGLFGDEFHYQEYRDTRGSVSVGSLWSEYDGFDPRLRARIRLQLPQWDKRVSAFAGRVGESDYVSDTEGEFDALPTRIFGGFEDESVILGLGYSSPERTGNDFDAGVGVRVDWPLDPYARARYEIVRTFAEKFVFRMRETVFWQNSEGFGSTTRFNIDRAINDRFLLRWNNLGKYTEETDGVELFSELTLFQRLNDRTGIAWQNYISGASDAEVPLQRYGLRGVMRRQMTPEWLFLELRLGVSWPREKIWEDRERSIEGGFAFEMQFSDRR